MILAPVYLSRSYQHLREAIDRNAYYEIAYACYFIIRCYSEVAWYTRDLAELTKHTTGLMTCLLHVSSSCSLNCEEFVVFTCALCDWYMELTACFQSRVEHFDDPGVDRKGIVESSSELSRLGESWSEMKIDLGNEPDWLQKIYQATRLIFPLLEVQRCLHYCLFINTADVVPDSQLLLSIRSASDTIKLQLNVSRIFLLQHGCLSPTFLHTSENPASEDEFLELGQVIYNLVLIGCVVLLGPSIGLSLNPLFLTQAIEAMGTIDQSLQRMDCSWQALPMTAPGLFFLTGLFFDRIHECQGKSLPDRSNEQSKTGHVRLCTIGGTQI